MLPETRPVRPFTATVEVASAAVAATLTAVVPVATVKVAPAARVAPLTVILARSVLVLNGVT